jgi:Zn-dependent protease with chaperone function
MLQYLIKFSLSLAVLYIFYKLVLRPLTFYQWNRFYLLCYSLTSFFIPLININPWVEKQLEKDNSLINIVPSFGNYKPGTDNQVAENIIPVKLSLLQQLTLTDWIVMTFCLGAAIMLVRLLLQYKSLRRIRKFAVLLNENEGIQLYETTAPIGPFSFGNAIFFNRQLYNGEELQRIIQHEFVHVRQKHTIDLMLGEFLCVINWFNPFAWFIRHAIRQNLEFIADNKVVENGIDKKEYQYLLLKVVGVPQYSIVSNFNFSNLKKRIAMMNKMRSAKLQLTKFLFVLPLLAVMLLAFRNGKEKFGDNKQASGSINNIDTIPAASVPPAPPAPPAPPVEAPEPIAPLEPVIYKNDSLVENLSIHKDVNTKTHKKIYTATVTLKDGSKEFYNLDDLKEKAAYIKKYGELPDKPSAPIAPVPLLQKVNLPPLPPIAPLPAVPVNDAITPFPPNDTASQYPKTMIAPVPPTNLKGVYFKYDGNSPLIIVDGIEKPEGFDMKKLDPNNLESVNVLREKIATIKYGDIAKNGVVEITTKKIKLQHITPRKNTINPKAEEDKGFKNPGS